MAEVKLTQLDKSYDGGKTFVLKNINLHIEDGEFVAFVGPSGCGKSTLLRMICGLEDISGGLLELDGERSNDMPPNERRVGMVFQSYALYPHMTVRENMEFGLKLAKADKAEINRRVDEAARILQLEKLLDRKPKAMSGGQRQRVAIGRSIVQEPRLFLFDEPLSNLDVSLRVQMRQELSRLHNKLKTTAIYVTHDQVEAMTLADRIVVLSPLAEGAESNLEQVGAPLELYHNPCNLFVASFIGSPKMNFFRATIVEPDQKETKIKLECGTELRVCNDTRNGKPGDKVTLGIRPQDVLNHEEANGAENCITGTIETIERLGNESFIYLNHPDIHEAFIARVEDSLRRQPGAEFHVGVPAENCHLFDANGVAFSRTRSPVFD
ncbi:MULTISPECIES: sn-glycerol-3-phosphate ABC transporter ATP-binding protein UgpC [Gammaproteobacteria]|uniref:ABC transporter ATP-binding protein n=1 Tax=Gammaproteobacteria TaxID=1236 RepID=UPI001ADCC5E9|nr:MULTISPECIES: sn-glycerol-3-phosphate ABC transporter ATP-binding protein UgpC [Gammaproteobacteria]MBO9482051.1 sn-glycerol-3-phosphate ABC transporter ATP-binding protein UgpC [Salinisphaera sp. G21_0]MBO9494194.1 sn-glycerol-3-phosphate ABC transporter ATP-binding protein UgpC [Thalassotalea sp. G20_0]